MVGLGPDTAGIRSIENLTSAAVKSEPSWNLTPLRSLNSHVVSLTARQLSARRGSSPRSSPDHTSVSNTCFSASACVPVAVKCGSIDSGPARTPIVRVCADTPVATDTSSAPASAAAAPQRITFMDAPPSWISCSRIGARTAGPARTSASGRRCPDPHRQASRLYGRRHERYCRIHLLAAGLEPATGSGIDARQTKETTRCALPA